MHYLPKKLQFSPPEDGLRVASTEIEYAHAHLACEKPSNARGVPVRAALEALVRGPKIRPSHIAS